MKKRFNLFVVAWIVLALVLAACRPAATVATQAPAASTATTAPADATAEPEAEPTSDEPPTPTPYPTAVLQAGKIGIRWFVGLGTGTDAAQITAQEEVVADFNASQDRIQLILEIVPYNAARDTLSVQIASGNGPDIVGPVGWGGSNGFYGQWLDLTPHIAASGFDTGIFDPALLEFYQTEEGQVGLPFAVFPGAMYFQPTMFDEVGLNYPPQVYGEKYELDGEMLDWNWDTVTEVAKRLTIDVNGNSAIDEGFDPNQIVQVGYTAQWQHPNSVATFYGGAAKIYEGDAVGEYKSTMPDSWKESFQWYYDSMWGEQPFNATGALAGSAEFGNGNLFNAGKAAMGLTQTWYTCCLTQFRDAGLEFQLGIQPMGTEDGQVHGRIDADTFRVWKGTKNPAEAFEVLSYLITTGGDKLLPVYGAMPAIAEKTEAFFAVKSADYPFVTDASWDVFVQGLAYPDTPSAEQYQPNWNEAFARQDTFMNLMNNTPPDQFDFEAEYAALVNDLNVIYNK